MNSDRGVVTAFVLGLVLAFVVLAGLAVDSGRLVAAHVTASRGAGGDARSFGVATGGPAASDGHGTGVPGRTWSRRRRHGGLSRCHRDGSRASSDDVVAVGGNRRA
jgi:hypothetical protein